MIEKQEQERRNKLQEQHNIYCANPKVFDMVYWQEKEQVLCKEREQ